MVAYSLGCKPRVTPFASRYARLGDAVKVVPRTEWPARIAERRKTLLRPFVPVIHNQNQENSCASNAATLGGIEIPRATMRLPFVHLAPSSLYKRVNHGRDQGSAIDENLDALKEYGVVPVSVWGGERNWQQAITAEASKAAANFRVAEWLDIGSFDEFMTVLLFGVAPVYGVDWEGGGGHAICAVDPVYEDGRFGVDFANSWDTTWGDRGFGRMWESQIAAGIPKYGAWASRQAVFFQGA